MTLIVDYPEFADAILRYGEVGDCCVMYRQRSDGLQLTFVDAKTGVHIVSKAQKSETEVRRELEAKGFATLKGSWVTEASLDLVAQEESEVYVAAVSYETKEGPGLWMDAYSTPPPEGGVLRAIFEEFVNEGLLGEDDFEAFLTESRPQVRVLGPTEIEHFIKQKAQPE